jgi:hypothetical protein
LARRRAPSAVGHGSTVLEVADILCEHGPAWREANRGHASLDQLKVMSAIERCRTAALGGHIARCENAACGQGCRQRRNRRSDRGNELYHWVFHCKDAVVHQPDYSRAARVVDEMMGGHEPKVWISDSYSVQQKHGERHQTCLAHLDRDTAFAFEHGSDDLPFRFKLWLGKAFDLARAIAGFAASTLARKKRELESSSQFFWPRQPGAMWPENCKPKSGGRETRFSPFAIIPSRSTPPTTRRNAGSDRA